MTDLDALRALAETATEITQEHRECGVPAYDGCYAHWSWSHCRADGMAWPCDVERMRDACSPERILALIAEVEACRERAAGPVNGGAHTITPDTGMTVSETDILAHPVEQARHAR